MRIDISRFSGIAPRLDEHKLPIENAVLAENCRFDNGNISAWKNNSSVAATLQSGLVQSIFLYEKVHWFSWNDPVNVINSPIAKDQYARAYFTGDGAPQVTSNLIATGSDPKPVASYDLGVPAPDTAIGVSVDNTGSDPTNYSDDETRHYLMTYVTEYGEEGSIGPISQPVTVLTPGNPVTLTLPIPVSNTANITQKRIYRYVTSGDGTQAFRVATVALATTEFIDDLLGSELGSVLETQNLDPPPSDMQGIVVGANGIVAGFAENQALFSEAYVPYAYPISYRQATDHKIVAIGPTTTGFVFATEGYPYFFSGVSPDAMTGQRIEQLMQACASSRSMVDMGAYVIYASPDGLCFVSESDARLITEPLFTREKWQSQFFPETIHAYRYEDCYVGFYGDTAGNGNGIGGFVYKPLTQEFATLNFYATAGHLDLLTDTLYLVVAGSLYAWDSSAVRSKFRYRSKIFRTPPINFPWYRVFTTDPSQVGIKVYVDGMLFWQENSLQDQIGRLPDGRLGKTWQIEIFGTAEVERFIFATSSTELD